MTPSRKSTKAIDMRFYWVQDIIHQGHYNVFWKPRETNLAEFITKHHPPHHRCQMRPLYLYCPGNENNASARVCYYSHRTSQNHN